MVQVFPWIIWLLPFSLVSILLLPFSLFITFLNLRDGLIYKSFQNISVTDTSKQTLYLQSYWNTEATVFLFKNSWNSLWTKHLEVILSWEDWYTVYSAHQCSCFNSMTNVLALCWRGCLLSRYGRPPKRFEALIHVSAGQAGMCYVYLILSLWSGKDFLFLYSVVIMLLFCHLYPVFSLLVLLVLLLLFTPLLLCIKAFWCELINDGFSARLLSFSQLYWCEYQLHCLYFW